MGNEKQLQIIRAGTDVFLRLGYKRATMADIANETGVSRPALYQLFENKDAIFRATVRLKGEEILTAIKNELSGAPNVGSALELAFEHFCVRTYEQILSSPLADDLTAGRLNIAREELDRIFEEFNALVTQVLRDASSDCTTDSYCNRVAQMMSSASCGFKSTATSTDELRSLIATLVETAVKAVVPRTTQPN